MKKFITAILLSLVLLSFDSYGQNFNTSIIRVDTSVHPPGFRLGVNKLDSQFVFWDRSSWKSVALTLRDTVTLNFASAGAATVSDLKKRIPGARLGDEVIVGAPHGSVTATASFFGWVHATDSVTVRFSPKATEDPASGVFHLSVIKYRKWRN